MCDKSWSPQAYEVVYAIVVRCFWGIWHCRNRLRFEDYKIDFRSIINCISASVSLAGNCSKGFSSNSIADFCLLKACGVETKPRKSPAIIEVIWIPPPCYWIKCNMDGAAKGSPGLASCGGIFRDRSGATLCCFAVNLGINHSLQAEIFGAIYAIEIAYKKGWHNLWLECDSLLVIMTFKSLDIVPWQLRNRWKNCIHLTSCMRFRCSHIFREGIHYADKIAFLGLSFQNFHWWDTIPISISLDFNRNRFGFPNYRFK